MAKRETAVSNEQIIAAILASGSLTEAAAATGIAPRTLYDRMGTREFRAAYSAAKSDIVRQAVSAINRNLTSAVNTVAEIMNDTNNPPMTRLQAAKMLLDNAGKFTDRLAEADRVTADMATSPLGFDLSKW